jgi:hypothetical protein
LHKYSKFEQTQSLGDKKTKNAFKSALEELATLSSSKKGRKTENSDFKDLEECRDLFEAQKNS